MSAGLTLVTGSAGRIGLAVVRELQARNLAVRGLDIVSTSGLAECVVGDIADATVVRRAVQGTTCIVHLAATPDDDDFFSRLLPNNIVGTYQIIEAARELQVQRVVLASTGQVVWWQRMRGTVPIGPEVQPTPRGWYACTKVFLEAAGRSLAEAHGRTVIAVRLGWCPRTREQAREIAESPWAQDVYLSPADAGRFFACAATAELPVGYRVVYASGKPVSQATYDQRGAEELGFSPRDQWPAGVEEMLAG